MFVRRSDVSFFCSIQRDNTVTGAYAMSASFAGSGGTALVLRRKRSRVGAPVRPGKEGFQCDAGASSGASATLRGPVRRSTYGAMVLRQVDAAISRSAGVMLTCSSFSASANVEGVTCGPTPGAVPNATGAPGVLCVAGAPACSLLRH